MTCVEAVVVVVVAAAAVAVAVVVIVSNDGVAYFEQGWLLPLRRIWYFLLACK